MQTGRLQQTAQEAEAYARLAWCWLLEDPRGRYIARTLLRWSGIDDTGPTAGVEEMAIATGRRLVGNLLKATLRKHDPQGWVGLEAEYTRELVEAAKQAELEEQRARAQLGRDPGRQTPP